MHQTLTLILVAALIAPAYSTSLAFGTKKTWSTAGCSGTPNIADKFLLDASTTCVQNAEEKDDGTYEIYYQKATCTADTATNGYTLTSYTDSACTNVTEVKKTESTGTCVADVGVSTTAYVQHGCSSTSATIGAVMYGQYSAAGCADSTFQGGGYFVVNFCKMEQDDFVFEGSFKDVIENGKIQTYKYTAADCSGTGTAKVNATYTLDACTASLKKPDTTWYKMSAMTDGASIAGASTLPGSGNTATSAAISVVLGVVCTVLNLMLC